MYKGSAQNEQGKLSSENLTAYNSVKKDKEKRHSTLSFGSGSPIIAWRIGAKVASSNLATPTRKAAIAAFLN